MNWVFLNPWWLLFGLASMVPLALYWLRRRAPQRVEWAAMKFLQDAAKSPVAKTKLKQWLLLALRIALPIMVAVVAATPGCINQQQAGNNPRSATHWLFAVDVSASMGPRSDGSSSLDEAVTSIQRSISNSDPGDLYSLVVSAANESKVITPPTADQATILRRLNSIETQDGTCNATEIPSQISDVIQQVDESLVSRHKVAIFSDFTETDWPFESLTSISSLNSGNQRIIEPELHVCGRPTQNISISEIAAVPTTATVGQSLRCFVTVEGSQDVAATDVPVELFVNGNSIGQQTVAIQPDAPSIATFELAGLSQSGTLKIEARIPANGMLFDDRRFLTVDIRPQIRVLCIEATEGAARNFVAATRSIPDSGLPTIASTVIQQQQMSELNFAAVDLLAFFGFAEMEDTRIDEIASLIDEGVSIVVSMGPETDTSSLQKLFAALLRNEQGPASSAIEIAEGDFRFDPLGYRHPIMQDFRDQPQAGLIDAPTYKFHELNFLSDSAQTILAFDNGAPALIFQPATNSKRNGLLIATTPLHSSENTPAWNRLPAWWSYVPMVNNTIVWLFGSSSSGQVTIGEEFILRLESIDFASQFEIVSPPIAPGEQPQKRLAVVDNDTITVTSSSAGFLGVESDSQPIEAIAFNTDSKEQNQTRADMSALRSLFPTTGTGDSSVNTQMGSSGSNQFEVANKNERSRKFYFIGLAIIAVLLLLEPVLSNRGTSNSRSLTARPKS